MTIDQLEAAAQNNIGSLKSRIIRKANGALLYDDFVPNGVYEELWD
jgi:hypothetical protein